MTSTNIAKLDREDEIDLIALLRTLWAHKYVLVFFTTLGAGIAIFVALTTTPIFRAEAVVVEASSQELANVAGLTGQLSGLAGLAGINLRSGDLSQKSLAVLQSRRLAEEFIKRSQLTTELFPRATTSLPTLWQAVRRFKNGVLSIRDDKQEGIITVRVEWADPQKAAHWANEFVALANDLLRSDAVAEAQRNINYLNKQITTTDVVGVRNVMYSLVEREIKTLMLANGRSEYAFAVIDPAVAPEIRISPRRTVIVLIGLVLGFLSSAIVILGIETYKRIRGTS